MNNPPYPRDHRPKTITRQLVILREHFPHIADPDPTVVPLPAPAEAEGRFVVPDWHLFAPTYLQAVEEMVDKLDTIPAKKIMGFKNHCDVFRHECPEYLRQRPESIQMWEALRAAQKSSTLIIPTQLGLRHRELSAIEAQKKYTATECGLGVFAALIILLTHPERLQNYYDLRMACTGDECVPPPGYSHLGPFAGVPCLEGDRDYPHLFPLINKEAYPNLGAATMFLPSETIASI